jgi:DNA-directed RNA polymerase subunit K/omega
MLDMTADERKTFRSSNIANKYELIIVAAKEARRLNELSRQTGLNVGGKVTNVALEEALRGNVQYTYRVDEEEAEAVKPDTAETGNEDGE